MTGRILSAVLAATVGLAASISVAQDAPMRIEITSAVLEPMPVAIPYFKDQGGAGSRAEALTDLVAANLSGTGLFRLIPREAHLASSLGVSDLPALQDWQAIGAEALVSGEAEAAGGQLTARFRVYDLTAGAELGSGQVLSGSDSAWRRLGHKISDQIYARITGEGPYFDSRIVFVAETGPKGNRAKRLALMDQDGANIRYLTDASALVLAPRVSPDGRSVLYTSYAGGQPEVRLLDLATLTESAPARIDGEVTFAPRFAPDGRRIVYSAIDGANTDIWLLDLTSGARSRLTSSPAIDTAPSFSPDGRRIVFESDRGGSQGLWVMPASGGDAQRLSRGEGRYSTPVWSPRGDLIAFTKQQGGQFHIGVMNQDGSGERLLTSAFLEEGPSWSPNGRVIVFTRETSGEAGQAALYTVDISGRNLRRLVTPEGATDPSWSPLLP